MMEEIKSVIFDWGGVLINDPAPGLMQYCARALGVSKEDYTKAHNAFAPDFQKNLFSEEVFWERICGVLNVPRPQVRSLWSEAFRAIYVPKEEMLSLAASLKRNGYKTALLSNTEAPARQHYSSFGYDMFDVPVFSCAEGARKPERRIYELTVERLGCRPEQSVFIDDSLEYINGAKQAGLKTILFEKIDQCKKALIEFGVEWTK